MFQIQSVCTRFALLICGEATITTKMISGCPQLDPIEEASIFEETDQGGCSGCIVT